MNKWYRYIFWLGLMVSICSCSTVKVTPAYTERVVSYPSVDQFGKPLRLSGKISIPTSRTPRGVLLLPHGTYTGNHEVPSNKAIYEQRFYGADYILVMPDYIGYGLTQDSIHPYLCGELTARACVDMLLESKRILDSLQTPMLTDSITIVGFSQGAAAALWTLRLLEEQYADRLPVKACYAGSGPYDVASEFDLCVQKNKSGMPVTIPMLVVGTKVGYNLSYDPSDVFTPATERVFRKYVLGKKHGFVSVWFRTPNHRLTHWMTPAGMDKSYPTTQQIYAGLMQSSLVHYPVDDHPIGQEVICTPWRPKTPTYVFHSTNDDIVDFHNSVHLQRCWGEIPTVTYDFGTYGGHLKSFQLFLSRVCELLEIETGK